MKSTKIAICVCTYLSLIYYTTLLTSLNSDSGGFDTKPRKKVGDLQIPGYRINNSKICSVTSGKTVELFVIIISKPSNFRFRDAIRETWATQANGSGVAYAFLIGNPNDDYLNEKLLKEHQRHEDLIQSNSYDSYETLTIKSLTLLQWVSTFCKHAQFVLKVDDDVMVNIQNILDFLRVHATATRMIFCTVRPMGQPVIRDPTSKYNMPKWMFPEDKLPAYCRGGAYVLTADSISPLWHQVRQEQFILLEDLLVTGIAAPKCGIQKKHNLNFVPPKSKDAGRKEIEGFFSYYAQSPENMKLLWKVVTRDDAMD